MISEYNAKRFCRDEISTIENYDKAIADSTQTWDCHHRDEIRTLPSGMTVIRSREDLREAGRYYGCPANELIFLRHSEHERLHNSGKVLSEETRKKMSESAKGRTFNEESKIRMSESAKGRTFSEETLKKLSQANKGKKKKPFTEEHKRRISEAAKVRWEKKRAATNKEQEETNG